MATGIKDKVAIIGMGCTRFGERWDMGPEELMVESFTECIEDGPGECSQEPFCSVRGNWQRINLAIREALEAHNWNRHETADDRGDAERGQRRLGGR